MVALEQDRWLADEAGARQPEAAPDAARRCPARCEFTATGRSPRPSRSPVRHSSGADEGRTAVTLQTGAGRRSRLTLDRALAPCTVASFVSLAQADYFDGTPCHRITTGRPRSVLQCGDPSGTGAGGPGYTDPRRDLRPTLKDYPRGTVAMANAGPNTGGSQFFIVYGDRSCPRTTRCSARSHAGSTVLDQIVAGGSQSDAQARRDGAPAQPVTITDRVGRAHVSSERHAR